ncbi:MAG: winged helix-turn-helix domain-containing protein [Thermoanaerobaculales bacterium]|jgi:serine/threonine-protein kinase|nr:winged helix-turn-helix domain-containing protein [Thermoanaerobaculales bacterium]
MHDSRTSADVTFHPSATSVVRFGRFTFDRVNHILSGDDGEIALPPRVLAVLDLLIERSGSVVGKPTIMASVWKDACVGDTSLTEAVSLLRQALADDPKNPEYIQTVHRRGYRFVAPVEVVSGGAALREITAERSLASEGLVERRKRVIRNGIGSALAVAALTAAIVVPAALLRGRPDAAPSPGAAIRLDVSYPQGVFHPYSGASVLALSPAGDVLVFVGRSEDGVTRLYRRRISDFDCRPIPGTEDAGSPFFSPDGVWVAFFAEGELRKTPVGGGPVVPICPSNFGFGGTWTDDGVIVFCPGYPGGLSRVSSDGGEVTKLTWLLQSSSEIGHWWPHSLPGGRAVLFTIWSSALSTARIAVLDLATGQVRPLIENGSYPRYSPTGEIFYLTPGGVTSVSFDPDDLEVTGVTREMVDQPRSVPFTGVAHFDVADTGTIAYVPTTGEPRDYDLIRIGLDGGAESIGLESQIYRNLRVSPRGDSVAVTILRGSRSDVWTTSVADPQLHRLTFEGFNIEPRWSPDGQSVFFASNREGPFNIYRKPAGGGTAERLMTSTFHQYPGDLTPDGRRLVYNQTNPDTGFDIWIMNLDGSGNPSPLLSTPANESMPALSPDGRWMAYLSDETGMAEVYLRRVSGEGGVWQISKGGGGEHFWSADGTRLYFGHKGRLASVSVALDPELEVGPTTDFVWPGNLTVVDALPNGREFIAIRELYQRPRIDAVRVVVNQD